MKTAGNIPIPNQRIENGIHATGGIGLNTLITKVAMSSRVLYHPRRIPKGMATTAAKIKPTDCNRTRKDVWIDNAPSFGNKIPEDDYADWQNQWNKLILIIIKH